MNFSRTFLVAALLSCHLVTHAQELSLRLHNVSVKQAMTELEHKSGYSFVYEGSDVNTSEVVTVNASTLTEAVSQILAGQRLHFEIKGKRMTQKGIGFLEFALPKQAPNAGGGNRFVVGHHRRDDRQFHAPLGCQAFEFARCACTVFSEPEIKATAEFTNMKAVVQ